jgi:hypothetical protein
MTYVFLFEFGPFLLIVDQEASGGLRVTHCECDGLTCCRVWVVSRWTIRKEMLLK